MSFNNLNLNKPLLNALTDAGYTSPTPIQEQVFSVVMSGRDVCGIAQTGTGKTLAYLLPCLRLHQFSKDRLPQTIVLVPTRELVTQVVDMAQTLAAYQNLRIVGVYGGVNLKPQQADVQQGADILVATPGRLLDLLQTGTLKTRSLKRLVLDEVDEMLNLGFRAQLTTLFDLLPIRRQNLLFSATLTPDVAALLDAFFANPVRIEAAPAGVPQHTIEQLGFVVPNFYTKVNLLDYLLRRDETITKGLVFTATKSLADRLYEQLSDRLPSQIGLTHANKAQNKRFEALDKLADGTYRLLITTDLMARGIDLPDLSHVINFDLPDEPETYVHRIGRTGRMGRSGTAISFVLPDDTDRLAAIETLIRQRIAVEVLPTKVPVSTDLLPDEEPIIRMKTLTPTTTDADSGAGAFHEKSLKNQKVNVRRDHAAEKRAKYGRPIRRSGKH